MKKLISSLVLFSLLFSLTVFCNSETLDKSAFEQLDGYEYDKFTKDWSYYQAWSHQYNDAYVVIGLEVFGGSDSQMPPELYCWIRDENNREVLDSVNKLLFLVGDDVYTFDKVLEGETSSSVLLGEEAKDFIEALATADSITVRLSYTRASIDEEIPSSEYKTTLKAAAKAILDSNIWDYVDDTWKLLASTYSPTVN